MPPQNHHQVDAAARINGSGCCLAPAFALVVFTALIPVANWLSPTMLKQGWLTWPLIFIALATGIRGANALTGRWSTPG